MDAVCWALLLRHISYDLQNALMFEIFANYPVLFSSDNRFCFVPRTKGVPRKKGEFTVWG